MDYVESAGIRIASPLYDFVNSEALPGTAIGADGFWSGFALLLRDLAPRCKTLLDRRDSIQRQLDDWHLANKGKPADPDGHLGFLRDIGYLVEEPRSVAISTSGVDPEIATLAGPQLVVPVTNARYALNAANARWGSLYDALYGTDAIPEDGGATRGQAYNQVRGAKVVAKGPGDPGRCGTARERQPCRRDAVFGQPRGAFGRPQERWHHGAEEPIAVRRVIAAGRLNRHSYCCGTTGCISKS